MEYQIYIKLGNICFCSVICKYIVLSFIMNFFRYMQLKRDFLEYLNLFSFKLVMQLCSVDNQGEIGENKIRVNIFLQMVFEIKFIESYYYLFVLIYFKEIEFYFVGISILYKILNECFVLVRKSMEGIDYFVVEVSRGF